MPMLAVRGVRPERRFRTPFPIRWLYNSEMVPARAAALVTLTLLCLSGQSLNDTRKRPGGWRSLFDGKTLNGWMWSTAANPPEPSWSVQDGTLVTTPGKGAEVYLLTRDSFSDFELEFEWKGQAGVNSGIKYRLQGYWSGEPPNGRVTQQPEGTARIEPIALEYQIADDAANKDALSDPKHACAALYEYWPAAKDAPARAGVWHTGRIVARGMHIEHWLDGMKVVDVDLGSPQMREAFAASPRKRSSPLLMRQERHESPIALQIHDGVAAFRNLRIRAISQ